MGISVKIHDIFFEIVKAMLNLYIIYECYAGK